MAKIYISLPITGTTDYMERAEAIEKALLEYGHTVLNPAKTCATLPKDTTHEQYMSICLPMMEMCDTILFDVGWENSYGCNIEMRKAIKDKMAIGFMGERTWENQSKPEHMNLMKLPGGKSISETVRNAFFAVKNTIWKNQAGSHVRY